MRTDNFVGSYGFAIRRLNFLLTNMEGINHTVSNPFGERGRRLSVAKAPRGPVFTGHLCVAATTLVACLVHYRRAVSFRLVSRS